MIAAAENDSQAGMPPAGRSCTDATPPAKAWRDPVTLPHETYSRVQAPTEISNRKPSTDLMISEVLQTRAPAARANDPALLLPSTGARNNHNLPTGQPTHYDLRQAPTRRKPVRFRNIRAREFQAWTSIDNNKTRYRESRKDHAMKRKPRTVEQKQKRRDRERGPWKCLLCEVCEFVSINGLRGHCATVHRQYCSWTGKYDHFRQRMKNRELLPVFIRVVNIVAGHRRRRRALSLHPRHLRRISLSRRRRSLLPLLSLTSWKWPNQGRQHHPDVS